MKESCILVGGVLNPALFFIFGCDPIRISHPISLQPPDLPEASDLIFKVGLEEVGIES